MCRRILDALKIGLEENLCILVRSIQRISSSEYGLCGHSREKRESRSQLNSKLTELPNFSLQLLRVWRAPGGEKIPPSAAQRAPLRDGTTVTVSDCHLQRFVALGYRCLHTRPRLRPSRPKPSTPSATALQSSPLVCVYPNSSRLAKPSLAVRRFAKN